jgi:hypothetical protein
VFEFGETRRLFDLGGEALAFKPRYNVQPAQYMPVILPGRKSWPRLRPQPIACQGGWPMPRPKGPAVTAAYLSPQNLSTAESSAYTTLCKRRRIEENRKVRALTRFIIAAALRIQQSTEALPMSELAVRLRENRTEIDNLRRQLSIMRKPVQLMMIFLRRLDSPVFPLEQNIIRVSLFVSIEQLYHALG